MKKLDQFSESWQKELDALQGNLDRMYRDFEAEQVMLSDDLKKKGRMSFLTRKRNSGICSASVLVMKAIYLRNARS